MLLNVFNLEILNKLGDYHRALMLELKEKMDFFETNQDIYQYIDNYIQQNKLSKAFPIGISINHIIAHDSFHVSNLTKLKVGDFIKIDVGLIEFGNIIDSARTFVYKSEIHQCIKDCEQIAGSVENFIRKKIDSNGKVSIQEISACTYANICAKNYSALDFLGGHTIQFGKVHGSHYILNKPLKMLPNSAMMFINPDAEIGEGEMFAIEIYIGEKKDSGTMIKSTTIPVTHYQITEPNELSKIKLNSAEIEVLEQLKNLTNGLVYEYSTHKQFNIKIINSLIKSNAIIKHEALEYKSSNPKERIKYIQYEDCFLISNGKLINLSK